MDVLQRIAVGMVVAAIAAPFIVKFDTPPPESKVEHKVAAAKTKVENKVSAAKPNYTYANMSRCIWQANAKYSNPDMARGYFQYLMESGKCE